MLQSCIQSQGRKYHQQPKCWHDSHPGFFWYHSVSSVNICKWGEKYINKLSQMTSKSLILFYLIRRRKKPSKHKLFPASHSSNKEKFLQLVESNIWRTICPRICILENYAANMSWILHLLREPISSISKMLTKWDSEFSEKWHSLLQNQ